METFNSQAYLLDFIGKFKNLSPVKKKEFGRTPAWWQRGGEPMRYEHVALLEGSPGAALNQITAHTMNITTKQLKKEKLYPWGNWLTPQQISLLTPKIKFIKQFRDGTEVEYPISDIITAESITKSKEGRGTDVAFKSLTWTSTARTTAWSRATLGGSFTLTFAGFEGLFMERPTINGRSISFDDLTTNATGRFIPLGGNISEAETAQAEGVQPIIPGWAIKIIIGWSAPTDVQNKIFTAKQLVMIENMKTIMGVSVNKYTLKIKDAGRVDLTCDFVGRLDGIINSEAYDLFGIDKDNNVDRSIREQTIKAHQEEINLLEEISGEMGPDSKGVVHSKDTRIDGKDRGEVVHRIEELKQQIRVLNNKSRSDAQKGLMAAISSIKNGSRHFFVDLSPEAIELYNKSTELNSKIIGLHRELLSFSITKVRRREVHSQWSIAKKEKAGILRKLNEQLNKSKKGSGVTRDIPFDPGGESGVTIEDNQEEREKKVKASKKIVQQGEQGDREKKSDDVRINFFFLGDLFNAAMEVIHDRLHYRDNCGNRMKAQSSPYKKHMRHEARLLLGNIRMIDPNTGKLINKNLADIPISLERFNQFWSEEVVIPMKDGWGLQDFLGSVCAKLITKVLSDQTSRVGSDPMVRPTTRLKIQSIPVARNSVLDKAWNGKNRSRISIEDVVRARLQKPSNQDGEKSRYVEFIYIYATEPMVALDNNPTLEAWAELCRRNLIPHLLVGNTNGMVQSINFERIKIGKLYEASIMRAAQRGNQASSQLLNSGRYNGQISLFGCPYFLPGMKVFIDPRSMGLGHGPKAKWAINLGLGGIHVVNTVMNTISSGRFITNLTTISEVGLMRDDVIEKDNKMFEIEDRVRPDYEIREPKIEDKPTSDVPGQLYS